MEKWNFTLSVSIALTAFVAGGFYMMYPDEARTIFLLALTVMVFNIALWLALRVGDLEILIRRSSDEDRNRWDVLEEKETVCRGYEKVTQVFPLVKYDQIRFRIDARTLLGRTGFSGTLERYVGPPDVEDLSADDFEPAESFDAGTGKWKGTYTIAEPGGYAVFVQPRKKGTKIRLWIKVEQTR
jgi:hypothetical protein